MHLHKGGENNDVDNYRPILFLPVMSKIQEKLMFKWLSQLMQDTNQYYLKQFDFCLKHSTTHAIAELMGEILQGFNDDRYTLALFIDLRKVFDCVDHNILLNKLRGYGITGVAHEWCDSYLHNQRLYISITNNLLEVKINIGVLQGSVLGPQLFLFMIHNLCNSLRYGNIILFADDTAIYIIGRNLWFLS